MGRLFALVILLPRSARSAISDGDERDSRLRISIATLSAICLFAFTMMLGGSVELAGFKLYLPSYFLAQFFPGFSLIRGSVRWAIPLVVAAPVLAGLGAAMADRVARGARVRAAARVAVAVGIALSLDFYRIPTRPVWEDPPLIAQRYAALAKLGEGPLLEIPWKSDVADFYRGSKSLLASTLHWRPLVNGYTYLPVR